MCLTTKQKEPIILDEDLIVYKILWKNYIDPYGRKELLPDILYDTSSEEKRIIETKYHKGIGSGFFHAYTSLEQALYQKKKDFTIT